MAYQKVEKKQKVCVICDKDFETSNYKKLCCSKICSKKNSNQIYHARYNEMKEDTRISGSARTRARAKNKKVTDIAEKWLVRGTISLSNRESAMTQDA